MNASTAEMQERIAGEALEVAAGMINGFDLADTTVQFELPALVKGLAPLIEDLSPEVLRDRLVQRIEELLAADEWSATDEAGERHARLYRVAAVLGAVEAITDSLADAVRNDAARIPTEGWSIEVLRRARTLGEEAPPAARGAMIAQLPGIDWEVPEQAAAIARARAELMASLGEEADEMPLSIEDAQAAFSNQHQPDARRALGSWLKSGPPPSAVQRLLRSGSLRFDDLASDFAEWSKAQRQVPLTKLARSLIALNTHRSPAFGAICSGPVDEQDLAAYAAKRIRGFAGVDDRREVATTLGGHTFSDDIARAQIIRVIAYLLKSGMPKSNIDAVNPLLSALGKRPLPDPEPLTTAVRRAQKRWRLKLTETQGNQLVALGVEVQKAWFGERIAKRVSKLVPR